MSDIPPARRIEGHPGYEEAGSFELIIDGHRYDVPRFCPHRAGRLDHGHVNERRRTITCPLHHSTFSLDTGAQLAGPPCGGLGAAHPPDNGNGLNLAAIRRSSSLWEDFR